MDGRRFVAAGDKPSIEIYDEVTQDLIHKFEKYKHEVHVNKVFVCKFSPLNVNLLYSGSWDRTVKFWDVRANTCVNTITGQQICGDSVDMSMSNMNVVTGGGTMGEGLKMWDMRNLEKHVMQYQWEAPETIASLDYFCNPTVNVARFATLASSEHGGDMILAGCRDEHYNKPVKAFNARSGEIVNEFKFVERSCLSLDISRDG